MFLCVPISYIKEQIRTLKTRVYHKLIECRIAPVTFILESENITPPSNNLDTF